MAYTLEQIKNESLAKGSKFFTPESKKAYSTRYSKRVAEGTGGVFFVTSEEIPNPLNVAERRFAVRSYNPVSGEVTLISALGQYGTDYAAHCAAKALAVPVEDANLPEHKPEPVVTAPVETAPVDGNGSPVEAQEASCASVSDDGVCGVHEHAPAAVAETPATEGAVVIPFPGTAVAA